ncbi:hypothetical protein [Aurantiacibacter marinus]|nr:hypothetical protein [Aurantiacibacter marinus]
MTQSHSRKGQKSWTTPNVKDVDEGTSDIENGAGAAVDGFNGRSTPTAS